MGFNKTCDGCGRCTHDTTRLQVTEYAVRKWFSSWHWSGWEKMMICEDCWAALKEIGGGGVRRLT